MSQARIQAQFQGAAPFPTPAETGAEHGAQTTSALPPPIPGERLERVESWGMNRAVLSFVYRPTTIDGIREVFAVARRHQRKVGLRGAGRSYGDASLAGENICLDLSRMTRILEWNPTTGVISVEPGV